MHYASLPYYCALIFWLVSLVGGSLGAGRWLLRQLGFKFQTWELEAAYGLGLGLAVLSYIVFTLAAGQWLSQQAMMMVCAFWLAGLGINFMLPWPHAARPAFSRWEKLAALLFAGLVAINLIPALCPETGWDGLAYHLTLPKLYLAARGFVFRPDIFYNLFPQFVEMLYMLGLWLPFGVAPKLLHAFFGVLAAWTLYAWGVEKNLRIQGIVAGLVFYAQFLVHMEATTAFIDLAIAAYTLLGLIGLERWWQEQGADSAWAYLGLFCLGLTAASKWHGLILAAMAGVWVMLAAWQLGKPIRFWTWVTFGAFAAFWALLPVMPYLWRAWHFGHNPFWPLLYSVFGGRFWDADIAGRVAAFHAQYAGVKSGLVGFLRLPFDLVAHGGQYGLGGPQLRYPLIGLYALALIWAAGKIRHAEWSMRAQGLAAVGWGLLAVFMLIWHYSSPQLRFLLPGFPLAAWLAAGQLRRLWRQPSRAGRLAAVALGLCLLAFRPPLHRDTWQQVRVLAGWESAESYCAEKLPHYDACRLLNQHVLGNEKVLLFGENRAFYLDADFVWGDPLLQQVINYRSAANPGELLQQWKQRRIRWVMFRLDMYSEAYLTPEVIALVQTTLQRYGEQWHAIGPVTIYRIKDEFWQAPERGFAAIFDAPEIVLTGQM